MMDIKKFIAEAEKHGVFLYLDEQKLKYKAIGGTLSASLREQLKTHKSAIVDYLRAAQNTGNTGFSVIKKRASEDTPVLSFAQQRMWFLNQYMGPNAVYNIPLILHFDRDTDPDALVKSLHRVSQRQASLRTRFRADGDGCVPVVESKLADTDIETVANTEEALAIYRQEAGFCFDLAEHRLFRSRVLRTDDTQTLFLIAVFHHAIFDGWSKVIFIDELGVNYQQVLENKGVSLSPLAIDYLDYAQWQRDFAASPAMVCQRQYWRRLLADLPAAINLPTDRPRPAQQSFEGRTLYFEIPLATTVQLETLSREWGATVFMTLYSFLAVLLHRQSGDRDIAIGTTIANRTQAQLEEIIGFFINTLVLRTRVDASLTFPQFVARNKAMILAAYDNQDVPFEMLVDELKPERSTSHSPLFQVMLVYQNAPEEHIDSDGANALVQHFLSSDPLAQHEGDGQSHFDLTLSMKRCEHGLAGAVEYNSDVFMRRAFRQWWIIFFIWSRIWRPRRTKRCIKCSA